MTDSGRNAPTGLPGGGTASLTGLLGRTADLAAVAERFDEGARLVTLVGPGGIGKTALARAHSAARVAAKERERALFVDLEGARSLADIVDRVALACGAAASARDDGVVGVGHALAALGEIVVVLDDFDAVVAYALATVGAWLELAPEAQVIATSRERLGLVAEIVHEVGPLEVRGSSDASALLVASARRASSTFAPRAEDVAAFVEIATVLDGVPLALEIAGTRLPLLGARGLLDELRRDPRLERSARGGPARHASVDAAVRGSFDALAPHEKSALAQLVVFRGGFTVHAVQAIVDLGGTRGAPPVLDVFEALRARSLVRARDGGARFDLYAQVRSFVEKTLPDRVLGAAERHAAWFVDEAERAASSAHTRADARAWLVAERENIFAVADRVLRGGPPSARAADSALRALVALSHVLLARGPLTAIAELVAPVVERTRDSGADPTLSARATLLRGALRRERGDLRGALKDFLSSESIARALRDDLLASDATFELGKTVLAGGELSAAREHFERAVRGFASRGARPREAEALTFLGACTGMLGDLQGARGLLERAIALAAEDPIASVPARLALARAKIEAGEGRAALAVLGEAVRAASADGDARGEGDALVLSGLAAHDAGDLAAAEQHFAIARDLYAVHGLEVDAAIARGHLGVLARELGRRADAYALLADARDVTARSRRSEHAGYFMVHLAALDADLGRSDAAKAALDEASRASREPSSLWMLPVSAVAGALATGAVVQGAPLHVRLAMRCSRALGAPEEAPPPEDALVVGEAGSWFRPPRGARVGLERRRSLALLLDRLAHDRVERPGATSSSISLFIAAWPGEKALASAAAHRVRVAIATLRKMGLRDVLVTTAEGYALSTDVPLVRV